MKPVSPSQLAADQKRVDFLRELLRHPAPSACLAAARANLNRGTVYRWKLQDPEFAAVWAEIVASRPRRRSLRRRVLGRGLETSHPASHASHSGPACSTKDFNDLEFDFGVRR